MAHAIEIERRTKHPTTIYLSEGVYRLDEPLQLGPADRGTTICARRGERAIIDGGRAITGWAKTNVNGRDAWVAQIPDVAAGRWYFHELFVNGQRRPRPRLPKITGDGSQSFYRMQSAAGVKVANGVLQADITAGADRFTAKPGDFKTRSNLTDIDVVVPHYWIEERMPVASFDPQTREIISTRRSVFSLKDDWTNKWPRYFVENVFEAMTEPGEWYLDRSSGKLYYLPKPGETPQNAQVEAPVLKELLRISGTQQITLRGLTFRNTDWDYPGPDPIDLGRHITQPMAGAEQSAFTVPGVITAHSTRNLTFENCTVENIGHYAIHIADGCRDFRIACNHLHDLGAGAIHVAGGDAHSPPEKQTHDIIITDNQIHDLGHIFPSATAIFIQDAFNNSITHNDVHDTYYTAISLGWVWGYGPNVTRANLIEKNNLYDIGKAWAESTPSASSPAQSSAAT